MESSRSKLNLVRGVFAVVGGSAGAVAPIAVLAAGTVIRWWITGASGFDRRYDIGWIRAALPGPVVGCATICACTAWATFAPRERYRFARSLAVITAISVCVWFVVGSMELTPRRLKGTEHPLFYPMEWMLLIGPPVAVAAVMTVFRLRGAAEPTSGSDPAPMTAPAGDRDRPDRQIRPA
jgi:hypothetical protein